MTEMLEGTRAPTDAELISCVRSGDVDAYGELFSRHTDAALRLARQLTRGSDAEDLVSEAFTKVMRILTGGGGPDVAFRAYLLTAVRRLYVDRVRRDSRLTNSGDMTAFDSGVPFQDTVVSEFESTAAARAFATLPERWQLVLWHLEVENQKPADIAPMLGMSGSSVCALAYRAREGLRQAFLTEHLSATSDADCRWTVEHLGRYVRKRLAKGDSTKVKAHLDACRSCTAMHLELTEINSDLRGAIAPLLLGTAAAGYLAGSGSGIGVHALMVLLGRASDALFGASGTSAGTTTGATAGTSAWAAGGTGAGTAAATIGATSASAAAGTAAATTAATTAAATTVAGVTTGGAVAGVAAGTTTAGVIVGAAAAGAATGATAGVGAAGLTMLAIGTAAMTLGLGSGQQEVGSTLPTIIQGATDSAPPDSSPVPPSERTVAEDVDLAPPPGSQPSLGEAALTLPSTPDEFTTVIDETDAPSEAAVEPSEDTDVSSEATDEPSGEAGDVVGSSAVSGTDTAPDGVVQESDAGEIQTDDVATPSEPDPSPRPPDNVATSTSDSSVSTPPDGPPQAPVVPPLEPTDAAPPSPGVPPELDPQPVELSKEPAT